MNATTSTTATTTYARLSGDEEPTEPGEYLAGGTDLIPLLRSGVHRPARLVDLKGTSGPAREIECRDRVWHIGGGATLAAIEDSEALGRDVRALVDAAASAATRQIRNRATLAGNLLQRSRCAYFRDEHVECWLKGGSECPAREGLDEHHALASEHDDVSPCITTHPSDAAGALIACGAALTYELAGARTTIAVADLLVAPSGDDRRLHRLPDGAIVRSIAVPVPDGPSAYLKAMDRAAWQFALVGVAAVRAGDGVRVVANGIAPTPRRLDAVEDALGTDWSSASIARAADLATTGLAARRRNDYKLPLLRRLVRRALEEIA